MIFLDYVTGRYWNIIGVSYSAIHSRHQVPATLFGSILSGDRLTIASNLNLPTAMTFGPDNKLYVSNWGFGGSPGMGEILQIDVSCAKQHHNFKKR